MRRVAITGVGILSCIGNNRQQVLEALQQGRSGIEIIPERKQLGFRSALGGRVKNLFPPDIPKRNLRQMGPGSHLAVHAMIQALDDAGLDTDEVRRDRLGIITGNIGNMQDIYRQCRTFHDRSAKLGGVAYQKVMTDSISANLSVLFRTKGYSLTVSAACATGGAAIGLASQLIKNGLQDLCICGGVQEDSWEYFCNFDALSVFSLRENEPTKASRPFDRQRDGLVPSAGCGLVVLEELEQARRRNAKIYAELIGFAFTSDGSDMTAPSGEGSVRCMEQALNDAGLTAGEVDYINAHATATQLGDAVEAQAIAKVFGNKPYVSSTKSITGHEQGAAGSSELIYTLLMMENHFIAPTINLEEIDPKCEGINVVANSAVPAEINVAVSNSFGLGGVNTCLVLRRHAP
ncbi:MAG: beta-ketoacyl-[acyl-carrier-protein] synthase family protein [Deltaproteobacteria bacterium]|nr:beta-ketoacyl-[acyl-carrier-protein] synthase family protein [Deltaproteobacteria bacterium]